ncbi:hypothetical protein BJ508DRAFT_314145 [Ascobolus immersus RN42]|uniref:Uncharacterized protein n=1 Tax=Ascobolus immersus RN42 TaxID=1160509 RepID=A0A3N4HG42_ASCIM|nr:hypothetical protein BJ508DRAFT_314145 [Ascobolus immersus RN42]
MFARTILTRNPTFRSSIVNSNVGSLASNITLNPAICSTFLVQRRTIRQQARSLTAKRVARARFWHGTRKGGLISWVLAGMALGVATECLQGEPFPDWVKELARRSSFCYEIEKKEEKKKVETTKDGDMGVEELIR